jgi:CubicO group peptidase (beta-lactamase class C family)
MGADQLPCALWVSGRAAGSHRYEERGLPADAAERVRCLFCASKPMVAMAVLSLLEQAHLELEHVRVGADGRRVDEGGYAVADLLWHRSPFVGPTIWEALRYPLGTLEDELCRAAARAAAGGGRPGYSDVLAWFVLTRLAEALAGQSWVAELQRSLRGLVGPSLWLRPDRELLELPAEAQMTLLARHRGGEVPMVHALTRRTRALVSPYLGALGSYAAVVSWFQAFASHVHAGAGATEVFPSAGYLGRALECCGRPGQRHAAALEVRAPGTACGRLVGVQAAGGALSVWFDPATARVVGVLGGTFLEDPAERRRWCAEQLDAAWAWAASPTRPTGEHQPCRGPAGRTVAWRGDVPTPVEASGVALG